VKRRSEVENRGRKSLFQSRKREGTPYIIRYQISFNIKFYSTSAVAGSPVQSLLIPVPVNRISPDDQIIMIQCKVHPTFQLVASSSKQRIES
jgi:hypothetical protein